VREGESDEGVGRIRPLVRQGKKGVWCKKEGTVDVWSAVTWKQVGPGSQCQCREGNPGKQALIL
jgi:hypothetical protein